MRTKDAGTVGELKDYTDFEGVLRDYEQRT